MAVISSAQAGFADLTSTWVGGAVPGNGDFAIVNHAVTVRQNWTVGQSHAQLSTPGGGTNVGAIMVNGTSSGGYFHNTTTNLYPVNGSGSLTLQPGVVVTCRGNCYLLETNANLILENGTPAAPTTFIFDSSQAAAPLTTNYAFDISRQAKLIAQGPAAQGGYQNCLITANTVSGAPAWMTCGQFVLSYPSYDGGILQLQGCTVSNMGWATKRAFDCRLSGGMLPTNPNDYPWYLKYCRIVNCGAFDFANWPSIGDLTFAIDHTTFIGGISTISCQGSQTGYGVTEAGYDIQITNIARIGAGHTRSITNSVFGRPVILLGISDMALNGNVYLDGWITQSNCSYLNLTRQHEFTYYDGNYESGGLFWSTAYGSSFDSNIFVLDSPLLVNSHHLGVGGGIQGIAGSPSYAYVTNNIMECQRLPYGAVGTNQGTPTKIITALAGPSASLHVDDIRSFQFAWGPAATTVPVSPVFRLPIVVNGNQYGVNGAVADAVNVSTTSGGISGTLTLVANCLQADGALNRAVSLGVYYGGNWAFISASTTAASVSLMNIAVISGNITPAVYSSTAAGTNKYVSDGVITQDCGGAAADFCMQITGNTLLYQGGLGMLDPNESGGGAPIVALQNNIFWRPSSASGTNTGHAVWYRTDQTVFTDECPGAVANWNVQWNPSLSDISYINVTAPETYSQTDSVHNPQYPNPQTVPGTAVSTPGYSNIHVSNGVAPGLNDICTNPQLVDYDRSTVKFDLANGGPGLSLNVAQQMAKMNDASGYNQAYSFATIYSWIRAGFAIKNAALIGAGSGGVTPGAAGVAYTAPTVSSVAVSPSTGTLPAGSPLAITVTYSTPVTVTGTPTLTTNLGTATYSGGSGTSALSFALNTPSGLAAGALSVSAANLNGGSIQDALWPTVPAAAANSAGAVVTVAPSPIFQGIASVVTSVVASPATADAGVGQQITFTAAFSASVTVSGGVPALSLSDGRSATYAAGSGTAALTFTYTVQAGDTSAGLAITGYIANGGSIKDTAGNPANMAGVLAAMAGTLQIDGVAPTAAGMAFSPATGTLDALATFTATVVFSKPVLVTGTPQVALNTGGFASYVSGSGSNTLVFSGTVAAGLTQGTLAATGWNLNGATIKDAAGNPLAGGVPAALAAPAVDSVAPAVTSITVSPSTADIGIGQVATFTAVFSKSIGVTGGTPALALSDGEAAPLTGGSGSNTLTFAYTVVSSDVSADLAITGFLPNGAALTDYAGNAANVSGLIGPMAGVLQVDGLTPSVTGISFSPATGVLPAGANVTITVAFSEAVYATGAPSLTLNDFSQAAYYSGGSGSNTLAFTHTVPGGVTVAALQASALNLNGGAIRNLAGNPAALALPASTGPAIASVAPTFTSVVASPATADAGVGQQITFTAAFSASVTVSGGVPALSLSDGRSATYAAGSGTAALTFTYTVQAGDTSPDLSITGYTANGAVIRDATGNFANTAGLVANPAGTLQIDGVAPTAVSQAVTPGIGTTLPAQSVVTLTVGFSKPVAVSGFPRITLNDGGFATYSGGSGSATLTFSHTVPSGMTLGTLSGSVLNLNGGSIADLAGNPLAGPLPAAASGPSIDSVAPTVSGVTAAPAVADLGVGQTVILTVSFTKAITVAGIPTLTLSDWRNAAYTGGTGTSALTFSYTVQAGDTASDLAVYALSPNGASLTDYAGNTANVSGAAVNPYGVLQIDGVPLSATVISFAPATGPLPAGTGIALSLTFNKPVMVAGTPLLVLNDGGTAAYLSGSGTSTLLFLHTVPAGQTVAGLQALSVSANGGSIRDAAGNSFAGALPYPAQSPAISSVSPSFSLAATPSAGDLGAGSVITFVATATTPVTVTGGIPALTLSDGRLATLTAGSGTGTLLFSYTVQPGDTAAVLGVTGVLTNGATFTDQTGNSADVTGLVSATGSIQVDAVAPEALAVAFSPSSGTIPEGTPVTVTVTLSKPANVAGLISIGLTDGGTATYSGGSGTDTLAFTHIVPEGSTASPLAVTTLSLNGGSITDAAGNTFSGALPAAASAPSVDAIVPAVLSVSVSPGSGTVYEGGQVNVLLHLSRGVTVTGGTPTLAVGNGGTATFTASQSTPTVLCFAYTVGAGQDCTAFTVQSLALNGASISANGNPANTAAATAAPTSSTPAIVGSAAPAPTGGGDGGDTEVAFITTPVARPAPAVQAATAAHNLEGQPTFAPFPRPSLPLPTDIYAVVGLAVTVIQRPAGVSHLVLRADNGGWTVAAGDRTSSMPVVEIPTSSVLDGSACVHLAAGTEYVLPAPMEVTLAGFAADSVLTYYWV